MCSHLAPQKRMVSKDPTGPEWSVWTVTVHDSLRMCDLMSR